MNVPGINLLGIAMTAIQPTSGLFLRRYEGTQDNDFGNSIKTFSTPIPMMGASVQPVPFRDIQVMGLEVGKKYIRVWIQANAHASSRGEDGDQFIWDLKLWTILEPTFWIEQDGWTEQLAVYEGPA